MSKRKIAVIDCETDPFEYGNVPEPFIWGFYDGEEFRKFKKASELIEFLSNKNYIIYAHNGGKFDYHFLLDYIPDLSNVLIISSRLAKFKIGDCEFRDSYNILPVPLAKLNKDQFDYAKMKKTVRAEHMDEIEKYLRNDCIYLYDAIIAFIDKYGLHLTQATASMKTWAAMGNKVPKTSGAYFESLKQYYYGGRVTPFKTGIFEGDYQIIDINSAYPRAMLEEHPIGNDRIIKRMPTDSELDRCVMSVSCISENALPWRDEMGGLSFPERSGEFFITGHEFKAAKEVGAIRNVKINRSIVWKNTINFKDYIIHFYKERLKCGEQGDRAGELFAKLLMNSLYGKFASNPANYKEYILGYYENDCPDGYVPGAIAGDRQLFSRPVPENKQHYYDVAVAASITGWVRAFLLRSLHQVDTPLYCDTDSIICKSTGNLKLGKELGEWKIEGKAKKVAIAGKKLYACELEDGDFKTASKGARLTPEEIFKVAAGEKIIYKSDAPTFSLKKGATFLERAIVKTA